MALIMATALVMVFAGCAQSDKSDKSDSAQTETGKPVQTDPQQSDRTPENLNLTGFPIVKQPITIRMMAAVDPRGSNYDELPLWQDYEQQTGIHIEWNGVPKTGYDEKKNLAFASGDVPDAFYRGYLTASDVVTYSEQGVLIPLNDLIDNYAPNVKAMLENYPEAKQSLTAPDGKIYSLPELDGFPEARLLAYLYINTEWLEHLGLQMPETTEQFYQMLKAFKEGDPNGNGSADEIPFLAKKDDDWINKLRGSFGLGTRGFDSDFDVDANGNFRYIPTSPEYKQLLEFGHRLYTEGLIDKEVFTQDKAAATAKAQTGNIGVVIGNSPDAAGVSGDELDHWEGTEPLLGPQGTFVAQIGAGVASNKVGTFAITNKDKYPEATIRWIDYWFGSEGSKTMSLGYEGITYTQLPSGEYEWTDLVANNPNGLTSPQVLGQYIPNIGGGTPRINMKEYNLGKTSPIANAAYTKWMPHVPEEVWSVYLFKPEEQKRLSAIQVDIETYVSENTYKFVTGDEPLSEFDHYVNTLNSMGLEEMTQIYKTAIDRVLNTK